MYGNRSSSFTKEQLSNLGVTKEMQNSNTQFVRPLFPILQNKPLDIDKNNVSIDYKILFKEDFRSRLYETHHPTVKDDKHDNYSLKIASALEKEHKKKLQFKFATKLMPEELNYQPNKRKVQNTGKANLKAAKKAKLVEKKLELLEQKENSTREDEEGSEKAANDSDDDEVENEAEVEDPELDDDTDYHNNYFDNGENYFADEDDALDDGPTYS